MSFKGQNMGLKSLNVQNLGLFGHFGLCQSPKIIFWWLKITLTSLYQLSVEVKQLKRHQKSEKWVLRVEIWVYALKMARNLDFWTKLTFSPKNTIFENRKSVCKSWYKRTLSSKNGHILVNFGLFSLIWVDFWTFFGSI